MAVDDLINNYANYDPQKPWPLDYDHYLHSDTTCFAISVSQYYFTISLDTFLPLVVKHFSQKI